MLTSVQMYENKAVQCIWSIPYWLYYGQSNPPTKMKKSKCWIISSEMKTSVDLPINVGNNMYRVYDKQGSTY